MSNFRIYNKCVFIQQDSISYIIQFVEFFRMCDESMLSVNDRRFSITQLECSCNCISQLSIFQFCVFLQSHIPLDNC